jgi:hypothetical protein
MALPTKVSTPFKVMSRPVWRDKPSCAIRITIAPLLVELQAQMSNIPQVKIPARDSIELSTTMLSVGH